MPIMPKTLMEMTSNERTGMLTVVVEALRALAEEAVDEGNARLAANAVSIAYSIVGCRADRSDEHLGAAGMLLEQGIQFIHAQAAGLKQSSLQ
jgi:hypothetical protein